MNSLRILVVLSVFCITVNAQSQFRLPSKTSEEARELEDSSAEAAAPVHYRYRPNSYEYEDDEPQQFQKRPVQQTSQSKQQLKISKKKQYEEELEQEIEEPDRLALLLEKSSFQCHDRTTGYYADDTVDCEVFHYCQESSKHSWVCPEGFKFHQVHLICMPPSHDNICQNSAKYHVVNEYLYKPINMEEHQRKPNISIKYADRYFPQSIYYDDRRHYADYDEEPLRAPVRQQIQTPAPVTRKQPVYHISTAAPSYRQPAQQNYQQNVYRSPEEINISLQQRRPTTQTPRYEEEEDYSYEK